MDDDDLLRDALREAGWLPGRQVDCTSLERWVTALRHDGFSVFAAGTEALAEYGGLIVGRSGPGATSGRMEVKLDPMVALGEADRFGEFERALGCRLFPLGEVERGHALLALSETGALYVLMDQVWRAGPTLREGLAAIVLGLAVEPVEGVRPWAAAGRGASDT